MVPVTELSRLGAMVPVTGVGSGNRHLPERRLQACVRLEVAGGGGLDLAAALAQHVVDVDADRIAIVGRGAGDCTE